MAGGAASFLSFDAVYTWVHQSILFYLKKLTNKYTKKWAIGHSGNGNQKRKVEMENGNGQIIIQTYPGVKPLFSGHLLKTTFL